MSLVKFPYTIHKGYMMPIIPLTILDHRVWAFVDSGATFTLLNTDDANRIGVDWENGRKQMIVVGDGSYIPAYFHNLSIQIGEWQITAPIGFSERLAVGFNLLGRKGVFDQFQVCFNDHLKKSNLSKILISIRNRRSNRRMRCMTIESHPAPQPWGFYMKHA